MFRIIGQAKIYILKCFAKGDTFSVGNAFLIGHYTQERENIKLEPRQDQD